MNPSVQYKALHSVLNHQKGWRIKVESEYSDIFHHLTAGYILAVIQNNDNYLLKQGQQTFMLFVE